MKMECNFEVHRTKIEIKKKEGAKVYCALTQKKPAWGNIYDKNCDKDICPIWQTMLAITK